MSYKTELVKHALEINKADAFLIASDTNRFWISEFSSSAGYVIATKKIIYLFLDKRYYQKAIDTINDIDIKIVCFTSKNQILDCLKENNVNTLMVEKEYFSFDDYLFVKNSIKNIINFPSDILRIQKTEYEIFNIQRAVDITCETLNWIQNQNLIGLTEIEVANMVACHMLELGASKNSFDTIVASGKNGAYPHHRPTKKVIEDNEFVTVDMGCIYNGYCSDVTRTFPIGFPHKLLIDAYKAVYHSNSLGIEKATYKSIGKDVDKICRDTIASYGFKDYFVHGTGHGVGINVHELPNVAPSYEGKLENNSIVTIEPGIYIPDLGGIRIEDMVLVKKDGSVWMTEKGKRWIFN
ncbi:MAG: aminopeptidase P family protein [Malacoplasma sp.]|nr:aminopeptidase P family protein [Malacoplasma sp.]